MNFSPGKLSESKDLPSSMASDNFKNPTEITNSSVKKGPLSFLSGALTSLLFAWLSFLLSEKVVVYFTIHNSSYTSPLAQSIASGFRTLIIGICFLSSFTFGFIGIGLTIVFIRSLFAAKDVQED